MIFSKKRLYIAVRPACSFYAQILKNWIPLMGRLVFPISRCLARLSFYQGFSVPLSAKHSMARASVAAKQTPAGR
jgi:hypothetical protein